MGLGALLLLSEGSRIDAEWSGKQGVRATQILPRAPEEFSGRTVLTSLLIAYRPLDFGRASTLGLHISRRVSARAVGVAWVSAGT